MPEVQVPVFNAPTEQRGLTDKEIENHSEYLTPEDHFDRWEREVAGPPTYLYSEAEVTRETVKAPVIASEALSHGQQLQESINHTPEKELIASIDQTGTNIVAARQMYVLAA